jgi:hypothetical protein
VVDVVVVDVFVVVVVVVDVVVVDVFVVDVFVVVVVVSGVHWRLNGYTGAQKFMNSGVKDRLKAIFFRRHQNTATTNREWASCSGIVKSKALSSAVQSKF